MRKAFLLVLLGVSAVLALLPPSADQTNANPIPNTAISAGDDHTCALTTADGATCWGYKALGGLGDGTTTGPDCSGYCSSAPVDVTGLSGDSGAVSAGGKHTCGLTAGGGVKCWGYGPYGQLGNGATGSSSTPVDVTGLTSGIAAVSSGGLHSCALTAGGGVKCWGWNLYGQLGNGTISGSSTPVDVAGLTSDVVAVSAGLIHTCAVTTGGGVKCWGSNVNGQLGTGTPNDSSTPVDVSGLSSGVAEVSAGAYHTCALTTGGAQCWGQNGYGALGDGTDVGPDCLGHCRGTPVNVTGLNSDITAVSAGGYHTCALTIAGGVKCWGGNFRGQLGSGTSSGPEVCSAGVCSTTPVDVTGLTSAAATVSAGNYHACALTTGGAVMCWGGNSSGQLGEGTTADTAAPVSVAVDTDRDGCADARELQPAEGSQVTGGQRSPKDFWDFFDLPIGVPPVRHRIVAVGEIGGVVTRFGATGNPAGDPLTPPPPAPAYHTAFDRGGVVPAGNPWNLLPPDGNISVGDIGAVVAQFGHSCAALP